MRIVTEDEARRVGAFTYYASLHKDYLFVKDGGRGTASRYYFGSSNPMVRAFAERMRQRILHELTCISCVGVVEYFEKHLNEKKVMLRKALKYYERLSGYNAPDDWCFIPDDEESRKSYEAIMGRPYPTDYTIGGAYLEPAAAAFREKGYYGD